MDIFSAVILGVVQGITEFLPISSTGHLILIRSLLGIDGDHALAFDALLHLATHNSNNHATRLSSVTENARRDHPIDHWYPLLPHRLTQPLYLQQNH